MLKLREYVEALLIAVIFLRFANTFVVQTFYIPSGSMEETLLVGDHLFVNRFIYGSASSRVEEGALPLRDVRPGDIVIFRSPEDPTLDVVKRCVGMPGDSVEILNKQLYLNGNRVDDESYAVHKDRRRYPNRAAVPEPFRIRDNFGPVTVPEDHYFCMGDNRDFSYDSRYWGFLPDYLIKGRALMIYWSYDGDYDQRGRRDRHGAAGRTRRHSDQREGGFFARTRWERSFQIIR